MQIQDLSYKLKNNLLDLDDYQISVEVFSLHNVLTVEPNSFTKNENVYSSHSLLWGNDVKTEGSVNLKLLKPIQVDLTNGWIIE